MTKSSILVVAVSLEHDHDLVGKLLQEVLGYIDH